MTVVLPRVSTAGSLRMMALTSAIRLTPMARVIVTAAGSPSGMALTARATAAMNISRALCPTNHPAKNIAAEAARMTMRSTRLKWAIFFVSGVADLDRLGDEAGDAARFRPVARGDGRRRFPGRR